MEYNNTCAAADITAWCLLAVVIAIVKAGDFIGSLYVISLAVVYVLMIFYRKTFSEKIEIYMVPRIALENQ
jgi:Kef-type K+ transport system membrane component KefB